MHPGGGHHRAHTLRNDHHVLHRNAVGGAEVCDKASRSRTSASKPGASPRTPGERPLPRASQAKNCASGMSSSSADASPAEVLMAAMQQHHRLGRAGSRGIVQRPMPLKQRRTIETDELAL